MAAVAPVFVATMSYTIVWPPTIGLTVEASSVLATVTAAAVTGVIVVVVTLFARLLSGVSLPPVVVIVTGVPGMPAGYVVVHTIAAPLARLACGLVGTQLVVAPPGAPVTAHVAFVAASGPWFVHVLTTVTGVPVVGVLLFATVLLAISAIATGVDTQCGSLDPQLVGGVVHTASLAVQPAPGGSAVVSLVIAFAITLVPSGMIARAWKLSVTVAVPFAGTPARVIVHSVLAAAGRLQSVVAVVMPAVIAVNVVFAGTTS